jgi:zinc protease
MKVMRAGPSPRRAPCAGILLGLWVGLLAAPGLGALQVDPPPPLPGRTMEFPGFEEFALENGLRVVVVSSGPQPVMSARLYTRGGRAAEPAELTGLAALTATVLTRGTATRTAPQISAEIEGVGASLSASGGQDFFSVSTVGLTEHMETAFTLLSDVVRNATFPDEEVELARRQTLSGLQAELGQPQAIASRRFSAIVYGDEHPYGLGATPESVQAIARSDMVEFRDRVLRPGGALLLVAGLVSRDEVEALARRHFGDWSGGAAEIPVHADPPDRSETRIYLVHRPGSVQSVVAVGHLGIAAENPDFFPIQVMNRVLGGGSDARLFQILREERGWTYGAYSQFTRPARRGHFMAQADVRTEVTDSTVVEILHQLQRLRDEPVPPDELEGARSYLAGSFPLRLETADQVAGQLAGTLLMGLPLEEVTGYPERIRSITAEEVQRVAREYIHPERVAVVVVGDGTELLERLEAVAPVELFDVRGEPLSRGDVLQAPSGGAWDAGRLESGERTYEVLMQGSALGSAEYRLDREGGDWVSTVTVDAMGTAQETRLRFSADDFTPRSMTQGMQQGPSEISADLVVEEGRLTGRVELPPQLGGGRDYDQTLAPGTLLPGMDEYALQVSDLEDGARVTIPYLDLTRGEIIQLQAEVTGEEQIVVPAGTFDTWRVELTGAELPLVLYLRRSSPHVLVRQEYVGQPIRFDLVRLSGP